MTLEQQLESLRLELKQARKATDQTVMKLEAERRITQELRDQVYQLKIKLRDASNDLSRQR